MAVRTLATLARNAHVTAGISDRPAQLLTLAEPARLEPLARQGWHSHTGQITDERPQWKFEAEATTGLQRADSADSVIARAGSKFQIKAHTLRQRRPTEPLGHHGISNGNEFDLWSISHTHTHTCTIYTVMHCVTCTHTHLLCYVIKGALIAHM